MKELSKRERDFLYAMCAPDATDEPREVDYDPRRLVDEVEDKIFLMTWGRVER